MMTEMREKIPDSRIVAFDDNFKSFESVSGFLLILALL
jgi:hypothetical protein